MESLKILFLCIGAAIAYGILHDQVTARICVEYFTIGHPPVFNTESPTLLAFGWGTIATWWVGLMLSIPCIFVSRAGSWPKFTATRLLRPIFLLMALMGCSSAVAGIYGYWLASRGDLYFPGIIQMGVPEANHDAFVADMFAHLAAYCVGFLGGLMVCAYIPIARWRANCATENCP